MHILTHVFFSDFSDMDVLELQDPELQPWVEAHLPKLHVLLGDSIARRSGMRSRVAQDGIYNGARRSATWGSLKKDWPEILQEWQRRADREGKIKGDAIIWLTGNDVYNKETSLPSYTQDSLERIGEVAREVVESVLMEADNVTVLGPLPRLSCDLIGLHWQVSAAYHLERKLLHRLPAQATFVTLGRQLTRKLAGRHSFTPRCLGWYRGDRTHLSAAGYAKLSRAQLFPGWLMMASARPGAE